jgi:hypothetical protein
MTSRRDFLRAGLIGAALLGALRLLPANARAASAAPKLAPKQR